MSKAPNCAGCDRVARLTRGTEIYPHRSDLAIKHFWKCDGCGAYCGCHPGTTDTLGTPAGPELRAARSKLHDERIDPLWKPQYEKRAARSQVYAYLSHHMGIPASKTHTGMFNLIQCREAWKVLTGLKYSQIKTWAESRHDKNGAAA